MAILTKISLPFITTRKDGPLHLEETLNRKIFESLSQDLLDRLLEPVQIALDDSCLLYTSDAADDC